MVAAPAGQRTVMTGTSEPVATERQITASDPRISAWVSASAGSGKTHVLVNRVIRLLLAGTPPDRIVCITFTKAAAAQMAGRLYDRLARWTGLDDGALDDAILAITGSRPDDDQRLVARRLFARALETPGGLKIQTIHAFCESLLHRFPLEAGTVAEFEVLDDASGRELLHDAILEVLDDARAGTTPEVAKALSGVVRYLQDTTFENVVAGCLQHRGMLAHENGLDRRAWRRTLAALFGRDEGLSAQTVITQAMAPGALPVAKLRGWIDVLAASSPNDIKQAERLRVVVEGTDEPARYAAYLDVFLTGKMFAGERRAKKDVVTKAVGNANPDLLAWMQAQQPRAAASYDDYKVAHVMAASSDLLVVVTAVLNTYGALKRSRAMLDYDDLIEKTRKLLDRPEAAWVLYKLDGGIDHILVDEAQDTSPGQWQIVAALAAEFFAGAGARLENRTLFAVGDEKQSIFSFQGADPAKFDEMRRAFGTDVRQAGKHFENVPLTLSYRSAPAVLAAVDQVFARPDAVAGLVSEETPVVHEAWRTGQPGLVEIWPVIEHDAEDEEEPWRIARDYRLPVDPEVLLAEKIATTIAGWIERGEELAARGRAIRPGDILILLRRRTHFMNPIVRALKDRNIPVAGADRMMLPEQIAVMDLTALGRFVLLPDDDLTLAEVLKSPLIGFDDEQLFALAHGRGDSLWRALGAAADDGGPIAAAGERLNRWLAMADQMPVFEFYARVLDGDNMRQALLARLGEQANDPIDEFLARALHYERVAIPSLQGFVGWLAAGESEVKRDTEQDRNEVRVMTVHGAKGLEANIVFLPDTCAMPQNKLDMPFVPARRDDDPPGSDVPVWHLNKGLMPEQLAGTLAALDVAREEEYHRLLYVAMTRARDRLYVCGYGSRKKLPDGCWYNLVHHALASPDNQITGDDDDVICWRLADPGDGTRMAAEPAPVGTEELAELPQWATTPARFEPPPVRRLAPSRLASGGDAEDDGAALSPLQPGNENRFRRGRLIHLLLQMLPELPHDERAARARSFLALPGHGLDGAAQRDIAGEVMAVLEDARFAPFFTSSSRAEVGLIATVATDGEETTISGQIDRLAVDAETDHIIDYKTNRPPPREIGEVPAIYLRQMAAYAAALAQLYPGKTITCALLWTDGPDIMILPADLLARHQPAKA